MPGWLLYYPDVESPLVQAARLSANDIRDASNGLVHPGALQANLICQVRAKAGLKKIRPEKWSTSDDYRYSYARQRRCNDADDGELTPEGT